MRLKHTVKAVIEVDYGDLEELIQEVYGVKEFSIPSSEEVSNGVCRKFSIAKEALNEYTVTSINKFKEEPEESSFMLRTLLVDMCSNGIIMPGEYLIKIYW